MKTMKAILSALLAGCLIIGFAACGSKEPEETTAAPDETTVAEVVETTAAEPVEETSAEDESETAAEETSAVEETSAAVETSAADESTTEAAGIAKPADQAGVLKLYNDTINDAYAKQVGYHKERVTDNEKLDAGVAFQTFKGLVYKFMGIGADNKYTIDVSKGQWAGDEQHKYLRKSTLTAADITSAAFKESDGKVIVTLSVKDGATKGSASSTKASTPIDKCGICVGNEDKDYYDHKTGPVVYSAIGGTFKKASIDESYSNARVTATIDPATGHLISLKVEYNIKMTIDTGSIGTAKATGTTHISYSKFKY